MPHEYRAEVLEQLTRHGIRPAQTTRPGLINDYLNDLYRFELRKLRDRLRRREIPKHEYSAHVVALRKRYALVSIPTRRWTK